MRLYCHKIPLEINQVLGIEGEAHHYLTQVLRKRVGEPLVLFNGEGGEYHGTLKDITRHASYVDITAFNAIERESPLQLHLGQVISRQASMDITVQKAVELGVSRITPLYGEYTKQLTSSQLDKKMHHWQRVIIHACQQCGRNLLPLLDKPQHLTYWLQSAELPTTRYVLDPQAPQRLQNTAHPTDNSLVALIGPESGLTPTEIDHAQQANFTPITLGPRILRTETASIAVFSAMQSMWGDA